MFILFIMNQDNYINKELIEKLVRWVECLCCIPITIYGFYKSYDPIVDRPIIETIVDQYI
jgi:hypothetical protein